uniref:Uncharacterized protein n=1 Tax=viral metagenome TaxID=1070528 RepID=A0A6C0D0F1_9ZZZZ
MNAKSAVTNQNLLEDLFGCDSNEEDEVQILKNKEYYIDKTNELLQDINLDNYYEILKIMLIKYKDLDEKKKEDILSIMGVSNEVKIVYKTINKKSEKRRNKLNMDDY